MPPISSHAQLDRLALPSTRAISGSEPLPRPAAQRARARSVRPVPAERARRAVSTYRARGPNAKASNRMRRRFARYVSELDSVVERPGPVHVERRRIVRGDSARRADRRQCLYIDDLPHLYPLAQVIEQFPRYLALVADTHSARIFVFAANTTVKPERIEERKTKHHKHGRVVAGALSAPYRELPPAAREGSRRCGGPDRTGRRPRQNPDLRRRSDRAAPPRAAAETSSPSAWSTS